MLRRNREIVLAVIAILAISGLYVTVTSRMNIPEAKGFFGHSIGILGSILMVMTETLYSLRKRVIHRPWGRLNEWLRFHIFTGIVGPYLLLLHTAWTFRGLAGVLMLMTILVVVSGFVGRYIYTAVPRTAEGGEIELQELEARIEKARQALNETIDDRSDIFLSEDGDLQVGPRLVLGRGPRYWIWRVQRWMIIRKLEPDARIQANLADKMVNNVKELQRQKASLAIVRRLLSTWHTIHVPMGMALFVAALFHIGAALYYATLLK